MMVACDSLVIRKEFLKVIIELSCMCLGYSTAICSELTIPHIADISSTGLIQTYTDIESKGEILQEFNLCETCARESITFALNLVECNSLESVGVRLYRTGQTCIRCITIVISLETMLVFHDITILITDVKRIDRSNRVGKCEDVTCI